MMAWVKWLWRETWPPLVFLLLFLFAWSWSIRIFDIRPFLLPPPSTVMDWAVSERATVASATWITARAALLGLFFSLLVGTAIAVAFASSRIIRRGAYPYAVFLQTVPIIAIAPLIVVWFGRGFQSVVIVSFVLSVFPIITNATTGMLSIDANLEELFRLHNASWAQTFLKLRLPSAVPFILAGLRIGAGAAVIGAIVGEFFVGGGGENGLGYLIRYKEDAARKAELFAVVIAATLLGVVVFAAAGLLSRAIMWRWFRDQSDEAA